jgi:hypothetical protein
VFISVWGWTKVFFTIGCTKVIKDDRKLKKNKKKLA